MTTPMQPTRPTDPAQPARRTDEERAAWWATLAPDALEDEIRTNLRAERRLVPIALVAGALTAVVLVLRSVLG